MKLNARVGAVAVALCASCYSPQLANPGFFCHADDQPACPDGQACVNNRCVSRDRGVTVDGGLADFSSGGPVDFSSAGPVDLSQSPTQLGCHGYAQCLAPCTTASCATACDNRASANGKSNYRNALGCGQNWCLGPNATPAAAGPGACQIDFTGTMLVDAPGQPAGSCNRCLVNATAMLFGGSCSPANDPNCNPSMCVPFYQVCLSDTP